MDKLAQLDHRYVWHPFTQMRDWLKQEPIIIVEGKGAVLRDVRGREYLDANSSIWTNLHGHNHPKINGAIAQQLTRIAHSSALGFANEPASLLAERLVALANASAPRRASRPSTGLGAKRTPQSGDLQKVFFSDDGSTALEVALKLAYEYARRTGHSKRPRFLSMAGAYHGDTVGAVSLGHIDLFHKAYGGLLFKTDSVMAPYCYRCPFNQARPERADAREYRKCRWECVASVEKTFARQQKKGNGYAGFVFEPLMQGAAGMIAQPQGWLTRVAEIGSHFRTPMIADEVMTGFGRTGVVERERTSSNEPAKAGQGRSARRSEKLGLEAFSSLRVPSLFACAKEGVRPDFLAVAKGLTGGYLPMAATLTTQAVFDVFLGEYSEFKTFFHGHSFTGNQLGSAAALASLELLQSPVSIEARRKLEQRLRQELQTLWSLPQVGDIRQVGLMAGIELVRNWRTRLGFDLRERAGIRVCEAMARRGVLTRPIGNVIVLMPPYCTSAAQVRQMVGALREGVAEVLSVSC